MVGGKLAWRDGGKPSDARGGYDLGCQQLARHVGWPGPAPPLLLKFTSEIATSSVTTGVFFTILPNTLQGVKVNFYTITLFHHEYFPFLFLVLHLFF